MTARYFVDSNVLVYARDVVEVDKQERANRWLELLWINGTGRLSYQVLVEAYSVFTSKRGSHRKEAKLYVAGFLAWRPMALDLTAMQDAWRIQDRFGFSWWDCLIVAAARTERCDYLLTEDLQHGQDLDGLVVVNPFETAPNEAA
jgi:predicted nucleic acid-binding protein